LANREQRRYAAVAFNGIFLIATGLCSDFGPFAIGLIVVGAILALASLALYVNRRPRLHEIHRHTEALLRQAGIGGGIPVRVILRREGVELGRDHGWMARQGGALVYEGNTTRFGIVRDDLAELPVVDPSDRQAVLKVTTEEGELEVHFATLSLPDRLALSKTLNGWPDASRTLPGPPTQPARRTTAWYLEAHREKLRLTRCILPLGPCAPLLSRHLDPSTWGGRVALGLLAVTLGIAYARSFRRFIQKDAADRARLLSREHDNQFPLPVEDGWDERSRLEEGLSNRRERAAPKTEATN
jgi:hypothetical protein